MGVGLAGRVTATDGADPEGGHRLVLGTNSADGARFATRRAGGVDGEVDFGERGNALVGRFSADAVAELERAGELRYVERDAAFRTLGAPSSTAQHEPWGVERVGAPPCHERGHTGEGVHVAVVDSGIDSDHPDLAPSLGEGYAVVEYDGREDDAEPWDDDDGHGTHCAGIADAASNAEGVVGVSTEATLHAVKVTTGHGEGTGMTVAAGVTWAADQGYEVISMSLGARRPSAVVHDAVQYATERGSLVVAAAGNSGPCTDCVDYPGAYEETIAVGSTDSDDRLSAFSATGPEVGIAAPGTDVTSTAVGGDYRTYSGTSMAAPHVAGAAALLAAQGLSNTEIRARLLESAEDLGYGDRETGAGLLNVERAIADDGAGRGGDGEDGAGDDGDASDGDGADDSNDDTGPSDPPTSFAVETLAPERVRGGTAHLCGEVSGLDRLDGREGPGWLRTGFEIRRTGGESFREDGGRTRRDGVFDERFVGFEAGAEYAVVAYAYDPDDPETVVAGDPVRFTAA